MFSQTDQDLHHAAYIALTTRINREGWMTEGMAYPGNCTIRDETVHRTRAAFIWRCVYADGERMKGTTTDHASTPATTGYGHAS